MKDHTPIMMLE